MRPGVPTVWLLLTLPCLPLPLVPCVVCQVREFPDVFALPKLTTTRPRDELDRYRVTPAEIRAEMEANAKPKRRTTAGVAGGSGTSPLSGALYGGMGPEELEEEDGDTAAARRPHALGTDNEIITVTSEQFDDAIRSGKLLEYHSDLFKHPLVTHRTGVTMDAIREVIKEGKLPLLEMEAEGLAMFKSRQEGAIDCLSIFLQPGSIEEHEARLREWLAEGEADLAARRLLATRQLALAEGGGSSASPVPGASAQGAAASGGSPYDHTIVNGTFENAYSELRDLISRYRPEILTPTEGSEAAAAAAEAAAAKPPGEPCPVLVLAGPEGEGGAAATEQLASTLVSMFPAKFGVPPQLTDRKPAKGEVATSQLQFLAAKDLAKLATDGALALQYVTADGSNVAVSKDAIADINKRGAVAVVVAPDAQLVEGLRQGPDPMAGALFAFVARPSATLPAEAAAAAAEAVGAAEPALYHLVVTEVDEMDAVFTVREALSRHVPAVMPPPYRPLVVAGPFGTGKRALLQRLFDSLPGRFAVPVITTTRAGGPSDLDDRSDMAVVPLAEAEALLAAGQFLVHERALDHLYGVTRAAVKKVQASGRVCVVELDHVADAQRLREQGFDAAYMFIGVDSIDELFRWGCHLQILLPAHTPSRQ